MIKKRIAKVRTWLVTSAGIFAFVANQTSALVASRDAIKKALAEAGRSMVSPLEFAL